MFNSRKQNHNNCGLTFGIGTFISLVHVMRIEVGRPQKFYDWRWYNYYFYKSLSNDVVWRFGVRRHTTRPFAFRSREQTESRLRIHRATATDAKSLAASLANWDAAVVRLPFPTSHDAGTRRSQSLYIDSRRQLFFPFSFPVDCVFLQPVCW